MILFSFFFTANCHATITIASQDDWSNIYGGKPVSLQYVVHGDRIFSGLLGWRLALNNRTLQRGELSVETAPEKPGTYDITMDIPDVDPGKIIELTLTVSLYDPNNQAEVGTHTKKLWIFDRQPLENHLQDIRHTDIHVFDPSGKSLQLFKKNQIATNPIRNVDGIFQIKNSLIIIGEGLAFKDHRGLSTAIQQAVSAGNKVLCLACTDGKIELPNSVSSANGAEQMNFSGTRIIPSFDKRIDRKRWYPGHQFVKTSVSIECFRSSVFFNIHNRPDNWPWVEIGYGPNQGMLIICGFSIVENIDNSPSAPYLLAKILTRMTQQIDR